MPKRNKAQLARVPARLAEPIGPATEVELARMLLANSKTMLIEYETGTHGFANRVEMTTKLIELTRQDIRRFEGIIASHDAGKGP